ncbi:hypothetical protein KIN20_006480 [Parelaphostrongylus tenuis]|uniref:Uncharacterized protein n=1 Tax=Parelaphostrongylus tenuis TaxID=148309 RepID=A0AAD5MN18_PARTN|nr:hypothetical protein KIN20_006480 [Parelaphostrongylus tenuis]
METFLHSSHALWESKRKYKVDGLPTLKLLSLMMFSKIGRNNHIGPENQRIHQILQRLRVHWSTERYHDNVRQRGITGTANAERTWIKISALSTYTGDVVKIDDTYSSND